MKQENRKGDVRGKEGEGRPRGRWKMWEILKVMRTTNGSTTSPSHQIRALGPCSDCIPLKIMLFHNLCLICSASTASIHLLLIYNK